MILNMYSIKDELNGFAPPIPINNDEVAKRYFREQLANNPTFKLSPKDFSIWKVGEFATQEGTLANTLVGPELLERG